MAKIEVITTYTSTEIIQEIIYHEEYNPRLQVVRAVLNIQDNDIRRALINLGWSPPPKEKSHER